MNEIIPEALASIIRNYVMNTNRSISALEFRNK